VVLLLFLIGLEVRPALLWRMKTAIFGLGGAQLLCGIAPRLGRSERSALALAARNARARRQNRNLRQPRNEVRDRPSDGL